MVFRLRRNVQTKSIPTPTGAVIEDVLNLDVQRGHDSGTTKGWRTVTFPHETINPRVLGHSSPGSYVLSRTQLAIMRRTDFINAFYSAASKAISDTVGGFSAETKLAWAVVSNWANPVILAPFKDFAGELYDNVYQPIIDNIRDTIEPFYGPDILTQAGWEPGRAVHMVQVRKITNFSFDWYCYGTDDKGNVSDINWIAFGTSTTPKQIPSKIQNLLNQYQNQIIQLENELKQLKQQLGL